MVKRTSTWLSKRAVTPALEQQPGLSVIVTASVAGITLWSNSKGKFHDISIKNYIYGMFLILVISKLIFLDLSPTLLGPAVTYDVPRHKIAWIW